MCTNSRYIYNKYLRKSILVPCGKCDSCLQAKANQRARRIRNHVSNGELCLFVMLSYDNKFVPYVRKSDLLAARSNINCLVADTVSVPIYRDYTTRSYLGKSYLTRLHNPLCSFPGSSLRDFNYIPYLKKKRDCMGVIYYDDVQNYMKRLRIILKRELNYNEKITYYAVGEYGGKTHRPHFHLLLFFSKGTFQVLQPYVAKAWPYGDMLRSNKRIQVALNPATYVASYVNKSLNLPTILESISIKQKHSHSLHFGMDIPAFSLPSLLEKVRTGNFSYSQKVFKDGIPMLVNVPVPNYVVNRYFPRFKGDFLFTDDEVLQLLRNPIRYYEKVVSGKFDYTFILHDRIVETSSYISKDRYLDVLIDDFIKFTTRMRHAYEYYHDVTGNNLYDFAIDYVSVWRCRRSYILKRSYDDVTDWSSFYENINDYLFGLVLAPTLDNIDYFVVDPNKRPDIMVKDFNLTALKNKIDSIRMTNGLVLSQLYDDL